MSFSFGFAGDDISDDEQASSVVKPDPAPASTTSTFPVPGKPQLPPTVHQLSDLLAQLPSKIAYSLLDVTLDDGTTVQLPRRELWDVRVQLMAEEEDVAGVDAEELEVMLSGLVQTNSTRSCRRCCRIARGAADDLGGRSRGEAADDRRGKAEPGRGEATTEFGSEMERSDSGQLGSGYDDGGRR